MKFLAAVSLLASTAFAGYHHQPQPVAEHVVAVTQTVHETKTIAAHEQPPAHHVPTPEAVVHHPAPVVHTPAPVATDAMVHQPVPVHTSIATWNAEAQAPAAQATHTVTVGGPGGLVYTPEHIKANVGDVVHFIFLQQNHSVTESTFAQPCVRKPESEFDSGLLPNPNGTVVPAPTWDYTVTSLEPSWWYCKQRTGNHCGRGMVFAINPTVEKSFAKFKEAAMAQNGTVVTTPVAAPTATAVSSTVTLEATGGAPVPTGTGVPSPIATDGITVGWNEGTGQQCNCACFCGVGSFGQGQGQGSFGGMGGSLPSPWIPKRRRSISY